MIHDLPIRAQALNPEASFIVQAPAGSGKTELLMQRFLLLLSTVAEPEQIVALTFTNKAAAEMKHRIIQALVDAANHKPVQSEHQQTTRQLANDVLKRNTQFHWHLLENPQRLHIQTIDALCLKICQNAATETLLPLNIGPADHASLLYQQAIQNTLLQPNNPLTDRLKRLLLLCDNHYPNFENMLSQLLAQRDQWLPIIMPHYQQPQALKDYCETILKNIYQETTQQCLSYLWQFDFSLLQNLIQFSYQQLHTEKNLSETDITLDEQPENYLYWQHLCNILTTKDNTWRSPKSINKSLGFTKEYKEQKQQCQQLLQTMTESEESTALLNLISQVKSLPPTQYDQHNWETLQDCLLCLPEIVAQLHMLFQASGECDFIEICLAACRVLGLDDMSDKALSLDQQLSHILVDECQDTSVVQAQLLQLLTRNWSPEEHKTLFLVGDPMQSIYRFRQAEVTLFYLWQTQGLGHIPLTTLQLTANFRSDKTIVEWFNQQFVSIFPQTICQQSGGIPFASAQTILEDQNQTAIAATILKDADKTAEAKHLASHIAAQLANRPDMSIAILLQKRSQAQPIIDALKLQHLHFQAQDIEPLFQHPLVQDWLLVLRALCDFEDNIAWLGLLRSPICGLSLADIYQIRHVQIDASIFTNMQDTLLAPTIKQLPAFALLQDKLASLLPLIHEQPLWQIMEQAWQLFGFNDFYPSTHEQPIFQQCQQMIKSLQWYRYQFHLPTLLRTLDGMYCNTQHTANIQLMTIHKSKGLEFDHVIIPGLQSRPMADPHSLIAWQSIATENQTPELCIAPLANPENDEDGIYRFCRQIEKQKLQQERKRLLYVTVTRAKSSLYVTTTLQTKYDKKSDTTVLSNPSKHSFADMLWPWLLEQADIIDVEIPDELEQHPLPLHIQPTDHWLQLQQTITLPAIEASNNEPSTIDLHQLTFQENTKKFGDCLHALCETIAKTSLTDTALTTYIPILIKRFGITENMRATALTQLNEALTGMREDSRAQWIFTHHTEAYSEMTMYDKKTKHKYIIDRTFIEGDTRWIIDYKSATPNDHETTEDFLAKEKQLYQQQLQQYAKCFRVLENKPIRCALYFPLCQQWIEWDG